MELPVEWLSTLTEESVRHRPGRDRWSIAEVLGDLIESANNSHQRFVRGQETDEPVFPKYDQNSWVAQGGYHACDWSGLVKLWRAYNHQLAHIMRNIPEERLTTVCRIGPYDPCTLEFLIVLQHHLRKISERLETGG